MSTATSPPAIAPLTLVTLGSAFGLCNVSPFCLKIEMLLTSLDIPFEVKVEKDPRKSPKGKMPFLEAGDRTIADSELIAEYIDQISGGRVYAGLSAADRSQGVALTRLIEDHLYWLLVASRWLDDEWFPNVVRDFFVIAPRIVRPLVANLARRQVRKTIHLHGIGRHSAAEQRGFAERDLQALEDAVSGKKFLCGDTPNIFDFTVSAFMAGVYDQKPTTWVTDMAGQYCELRDYTERVQEQVGVYGRFT